MLFNNVVFFNNLSNQALSMHFNNIMENEHPALKDPKNEKDPEGGKE